MRVIVKCEKCGNEISVGAVTSGNVAFWGQELSDGGFYLNNVKIDVCLEQDVVSDIDDVKAKLKEIRIDCNNCGNYICLVCK